MLPPRNVLILYEHSRAGATAIDLAHDLADTEGAAITVVGITPQAPSGSRCGNSAIEYNEIVAESVAKDLDEARGLLHPAAAKFELLTDANLAQFAQAGGFDLVLLPARRRPLRKPGHPAASVLSRAVGAEIRIVEPASPAQRPRSPRPAGAAG